MPGYKVISKEEVSRVFSETYAEYPQEFQWLLTANDTRMRWQVEQVLTRVPAGGTVIDIGAGLVPFLYICQKLGFKSYLVDDLQDDTYKEPASQKIIELFEESGVAFIKDDAFSSEFTIDPDIRFNMITTHDSMEHWHNSPKGLFHKLWDNLEIGGVLWVGVPNCVNLRKRITVPLGNGKWSQMKDWYEPEIFRGHVREPDVGDLRYIGKDLGASKIEIEGRNWIGYRHTSKFIKTVIPFVDKPMRMFPSICSDIYLFATK